MRRAIYWLFALAAIAAPLSVLAVPSHWAAGVIAFADSIPVDSKFFGPFQEQGRV